MDKEAIKKGTLNRRDFLISLGAGTSLAIAGFFAVDAIATAANEHADDPSDKPKLSEHVRKTFENGQMVLCGEKAKCSVNKTGERIIELLNGKNTLSQLAAQISDAFSIEHTESVEASIASFLCQLGSLGFLSSPFYVTLYETY